MNLLAPVSAIMTTDLITLDPEDVLWKAKEIFETNKIHHLPVIEDGKLVGMLSKSDFLFFRNGFQDSISDEDVEHYRLKTHKVKEVMTRHLGKLSADDKINVALEVFKANMFHAIPIVEGEKLVGIVTTLDIIQHLADDTEVTSVYS